ncbi:acyltransferase family protein [Rhodopila sp.]|uniref:acyltransferase family protein n=1 Tax=Rhodopila sp. TaxID=2480087 RepID=UPI003D0D9D9A
MGELRKPHFAYIECVRGYAILLVIICHGTYLFPDLPYPVHRISVLGWHGVQLFFLASTVTLMMSWKFEKIRNGSVDVRAFFLRRFFRIAPAYYLASILYFFLQPPAGGFDLLQAAASYVFVNGWHPVLMGVTKGAWSVVPGGWSIGIEFTFYSAFPILACVITSLRRAILLFLGTLLAGATLNSMLWPHLTATFGMAPADNFLYFWFPNQMSVFALGLCLFFILERIRDRGSMPRLHPDLIASLSAVMFASCGFIPMPHWLTLRLSLPPTFLLASLAFAVFMLALARSRTGVFVNPPMALIGRVSFSAYLLHFAALKIVSDQPILWRCLHSSGWFSIVAFGAVMTGVVAVVVAASWLSYRCIELPGIAVGKALIQRRGRAIPQGLA